MTDTTRASGRITRRVSRCIGARRGQPLFRPRRDGDNREREIVTTFDESMAKVSREVQSAIQQITDMAGTTDADWSVLVTAGEMVAAYREMLARIIDAIKIDMSETRTQEPDPDGPWLPAGIVVDIHEVLATGRMTETAAEPNQ